ncbi:MAG: FAD-binding oxidoreductase, partial [Pyrinomonadaceae bacterium]|nr:FAD-binding oxidoreductase [Pyrinomonadaceae bacterium]
RKKLWAARKGAFGAVARIAPDSMIQDAVVPRSRLAEVLAASYEIASKYQLRLANVFHAGDGNLHPLICFDSRSPDEVRRVKEAGRELMETCVRAGGSISGEHGVGLDKRDFLPLIFSDDDMEAMLRVRAAFDPLGLCNPGKIIPMLRGCGEARVLSEPRAVATGSVGLETKQRGVASLSNPENSVPERHSHSAREDGKAMRPSSAIFDPDDAARQLAGIVGEANVSPCLRPSVSPRPPFSPSPPLPISPSLSVAPGSIAEACEVMKLTAREGWSVVPAGAATWLDAGNPLGQVNVVISTARLNQFLDHEPADLVASAQAGVTLERFNETLAASGQWLPLDPPDDGRATLGGVVATGLAGAQKCGYGMPRNFVIGMRVVLVDGKIVKAGGRVVKNVAGYDLCKLFTGSYGTLGLIAELTFKLRPRPAKEVTVLATGSMEAILERAQALYETRLFPVAIELVSSNLARQVGVETAENHLLLLARFAGISKTVNYQVEQAITRIREATEIGSIETESSDRNLWHRLAATASKLAGVLGWRVTIPPTRVGQFIEIVKDRFANSFPKSLWQAGIADGRVRMMEPFGANTEEHSNQLTHLRSIAESFGGSLVIESASDELKLAMNAWGRRGNSDAVMKRIKAELDPRGLFSPGRY